MTSSRFTQQLLDSAEVIPNVQNHLFASFERCWLEGANIEFGVWNGAMLNKIARHNKGQSFWGFDSFRGLPEDWNKENPKGRFACDIPNVEKNVTLVIGLFQDTLLPWLDENKDNIRFARIDCDLYSSAKYLLDTLNERLVKGTVLVFDEIGNFNNSYPEWEQGEFKAVSEWLEEYNREVEILFRDNTTRATLIVRK